MAKLSPEARAWLDAARGADDPTPEQRARADAAARIALAMHGMTDMPRLEGSVPRHPPAAAPAGAGRLGSALGSKLLAGAGLAAVLAGGLIAWRALQPAAEPAPSAHTTHPLAAAPAKAAVSAAPPEPLPALAVQHRVSAPTPRTHADRHRSGASRRRDRLTWQRDGASRQRDVLTPTAHTHAHDADLQAEVALLTAANSAIRAEHMSEATRLLTDHAGRFPRGALREERRALELIVLCGHGPSERAAEAVQSFLRSAPQSVLAQRVRAACRAQDGPP